MSGRLSNGWRQYVTIARICILIFGVGLSRRILRLVETSDDPGETGLQDRVPTCVLPGVVRYGFMPSEILTGRLIWHISP
jgi:hypothetical protein